MRLPSADGTYDGGHCCRCVVLGALFLLCAMIFWTGHNTCDIWIGHKENYEDKTRHPSTSGTDGGGGC